MNSIKFQKVPVFIKKYIQAFLNCEAQISICEDIIKVTISHWEYFYLSLDSDKKNIFSYAQEKGTVSEKSKESINKLIEKLNTVVETPISLMLGYKLNNFDISRLYVVWLYSGQQHNDITEQQRLVLNSALSICTNNIQECRRILGTLWLTSIDIFDIYTQTPAEISHNHDELVFCRIQDNIWYDKNIALYLWEFRSLYNDISIIPTSSHIIQDFVASCGNMMSFLYLWKAQSIILENMHTKLQYFTYHHIFKRFNITVSISFEDWIQDIIEISQFLQTKLSYNSDIMFEYIIHNKNDTHVIQKQFTSASLDIESLLLYTSENYFGSFLLYHKNVNQDFTLVSSKHSISENGKNMYFLSGPIVNDRDITPNTKLLLEKAKTLYSESVDSTKRLCTDLNIFLEDVDIYDGDDVHIVWNENGIVDGVWESFPELYRLLRKGEDITFITEWWIPCLLDPGDYIKKYVLYNFPDYNIHFFPWPQIIPTVLSVCEFEYSGFFWFSVYLQEENLFFDKIFFHNAIFKNSIFIIFSFWSRARSDFKFFQELFPHSQIQIIHDIWSFEEQNEIYNLQDIDEKKISLFQETIDNVVYIIKQ